jgi:hypothetical protein
MPLAGDHAVLKVKMSDKQKAPHAALCCLRILMTVI